MLGVYALNAESSCREVLWDQRWMCAGQVQGRPLDRRLSGVQSGQPPGRRRGWGARAVGLSLALGRTGVGDMLLLGSVWSEGPGRARAGERVSDGPRGLRAEALGTCLEVWAPPGALGGAWAFLRRLGVAGRQFPRSGCETQWRQEVRVEVSQVEAGD